MYSSGSSRRGNPGELGQASKLNYGCCWLHPPGPTRNSWKHSGTPTINMICVTKQGNVFIAWFCGKKVTRIWEDRALCNISVIEINSEICPVTVGLKYLEMCHKAGRFLFFVGATPITRHRFGVMEKKMYEIWWDASSRNFHYSY